MLKRLAQHPRCKTMSRLPQPFWLKPFCSSLVGSSLVGSTDSCCNRTPRRAYWPGVGLVVHWRTELCRYKKKPHTHTHTTRATFIGHPLEA